MDLKEKFSTWVEIDLEAIKTNVRLVRQKTKTAVMAVVKANAYGHGAVPVAKAALQGGAAWLGVARLEEALHLRQANLDCPILLLGYTPPGRYIEAIQNKISITVWETGQISAISQVALKLNESARLHLKVDTGMSRIGVQPKDTLELALFLEKASSVVFEGMFTHFAHADAPDLLTTNEQEALFLEVIEALKKSDLKPEIIHCANSAATLTRSNTEYNLVRLGIAMYGLHPSSKVPLPEGFRPALSWKSILTQVKSLPAGRGISYGHEYVTQREERIGTVPLGYADGFRLVKGNLVLVGGKPVPVVGRVCMDQLMVALDINPDAQVGDEVVIIGKQGKEEITAEDIAQRWGTVNYEVVCGISSRVIRVYVK